MQGRTSHRSDQWPRCTRVFAIAAAILPRYRLLVLLATFAQLRFGELVALRRSDIALTTMEITVRRKIGELDGGAQYEGDPKSAAGKRTISLPAGLRHDMETHLANYAQPGPDGLLFAGIRGAIPRRRNFNRTWKKALRAAGAPEELHLHDLRHTGSTLSASSGASLRELMARIGHSSTRAAMIYQHATRERDHAIAAALDALIDDARGATPA